MHLGGGQGLGAEADTGSSVSDVLKHAGRV